MVGRGGIYGDMHGDGKPVGEPGGTVGPKALDARAYHGNWCEHCRCEVCAEHITNTGNHTRCGKQVERIALVIVPARDFARN